MHLEWVAISLRTPWSVAIVTAERSRHSAKCVGAWHRIVAGSKNYNS